MGVGTWPCIFKLGNSFYDYTKFKLANEVWTAYNISNETYGAVNEFYNYGWCQALQDTDNATCTGDFYAGAWP